MLKRLPARHVHLDFHTSEHIAGVGSRFDPRRFQKALKLGRVNHITVFAKCHHGWSYYPTRVGQAHPTLRLPDGSQDLLGAMIRAGHEIGVRVPVYITVGWSAKDAQDHPEWCCRNPDGTPAMRNLDPAAPPEAPRPFNSWVSLCVNTDYRRLVLEQTREVCEAYPIDGLFFDICHFRSCHCDKCRSDMAAAGVDVNDEPAAAEFYTGVWESFFKDCRRVLAQRHPEATVFFNGRAHQTTPRRLLAQQTHFELEDLPTTWGGYDKFPLRARFFANDDRPMLAMSGKFHTSWGEFGGFKHADAMRFEAAAMIAYGASCSFGDQLHPCGEMDLETYRLIGQAYRYVRRIEDFGLESRPCANLALWPCNETRHDQGAVNMLMEGQVDFEVVTPESDLSGYDTIVLAGGRCLDGAAAAKLADFVARGGALLAMSESPLDPRKERFLLDVGADFRGPANFKVDYLVAGKELAKGVVTSPILCDEAAPRVSASRGATVLAGIREPYFDRTYAAYCSHRNTPSRLEDAGHVGAVQKGKVIYLAHALGAMYYQLGARAHRDVFLNALRRLHRRPRLEVRLPSAARATLLHQPRRRRYVAHLLYGPPLQRGKCLVIEDLPELRDVLVKVRLKEKIKRATLPLEKKRVTPRRIGGAWQVRVPRVQCHQVLVLEY